MIKLLQILAAVVLLLGVAHTADDDKTKNDNYLKPFRESLGVYAFTTSDYPAAFAIVAGVSIILVVAVIFIVVGLLTADPGKDSIIYRMTTTRMKKD